jgi:exopolyphosphatase/guanosine-5'-triphosphate,3'-diphosphate pyrophosphatase
MNIASIDIGTNTVILLIAEIKNGKDIIPLVDKVTAPRLGKGLTIGDKLPSQNIERLISTLDEYKDIASAYGCKIVLPAGTAALRNASNSAEVTELIKARYGWELNIISSYQEAEYSYLGAIGNSDSKFINLVIDIGGGSTEISFGNGLSIISSKGFQTGAVIATEKFFTNQPPAISEKMELEKYLNEEFKNIQNLHLKPDYAYGIAGTPVTIAGITMNLDSFDESRLNGATISRQNVSDVIDKLMQLTSSEIAERYKEIVLGREDIILSSSIILLKIMEFLQLSAITVSTKGLRYGQIVKYLKDNKLNLSL